MSLTVYRELEQRSDEWHQARLGIVTASMIGRLITPTLKVADNETARGIIAGLAAERIAGTSSESTFTSDDMWRGILHEPIARDRYAEVTGSTVDEVGFMVREQGSYRLGASPDGLVGDDGGLEVKCPRPKSHVLTIITGQIPHGYMAQVQACLFVSGRKWWDFVSFHGGLPLYIQRIEGDPRWFAAIDAAVASAEQDIARILADYSERAADLPPTEPVADLDDITI